MQAIPTMQGYCDYERFLRGDWDGETGACRLMREGVDDGKPGKRTRDLRFVMWEVPDEDYTMTWTPNTPEDTNAHDEEF